MSEFSSDQADWITVQGYISMQIKWDFDLAQGRVWVLGGVGECDIDLGLRGSGIMLTIHKNIGFELWKSRQLQIHRL
jgi:hypothetical protein